MRDQTLGTESGWTSIILLGTPSNDDQGIVRQRSLQCESIRGRRFLPTLSGTTGGRHITIYGLFAHQRAAGSPPLSGGHGVFGAMGGVGLTLTLIWLKVIHNPADHPIVNKSELDYIADGGGLVSMDDARVKSDAAPGAQWDHIKQLFSSRMMVGIFLGQFCINAITYFFIIWFPVYLVQARGMSILKIGFVAAVPAICGFSGGIIGGIVQATGSFNGALVFVGANAVVAAFSYLFVVGDIKRMELRKVGQ